MRQNMSASVLKIRIYRAPFPQELTQRIFHDRRKRGVSHHESAVAAPFEAVSKQAECVGVTLKVSDVVPQFGAQPVFEISPLALGEERLNGLLAGVSERRVAHVVRQACRAYYGADLREQRVGQLGPCLHNAVSHVVAERHAHACHLQTVSEAVMYENAARQREHLSLVLHAAERRREYQPVVVALKLRAVVVPYGVARLLSESFVRYKLFPVHHLSANKAVCTIRRLAAQK